MERRFNVAGRCRPDEHYMLPPLRRIPTVQALVDRKAYFVLHAPRQVGKTTALLAMAKELTASGRYVAAMLSMETGAPYRDNVPLAEQAILDDWRRAAEAQLPAELRPPPWPAYQVGGGIAQALAAWTRAAPRPLVIFLDEIDALHDATLVAVLRQLRSGYNWRPAGFPWSLALCGVRDVRDYKIDTADGLRSHGASPFNIKDESLSLRNFTADEVAELLGQHTEATGQVFHPEALAQVFALTCGQPWLVNALARQLVETLVPDPRQPVTAADVEAAKELLIRRRDTHIDSLADKLHDPRVRRVIEPILVGTYLSMDMMNDDLVYVRDLGLITDQPSVRIANPIYAEIIPRSLTYIMQVNLGEETRTYLRPDGALDMDAILAAFQRFFAENSEAWLSRFDYHEAGPHLMLMAFLQKVVNGGGRLQREFALGSGRADLLVTFAGRRYPLELKVRRSEKTLQQGLEQLGAYLDRLGEPTGYLLLFDQRALSWEERLFQTDAVAPGGQAVRVFGM